ncbi:helix-turn-helix transcriptional regulator [Streptomyces sp. NPDC057748]|uniref:helix-turn-helix transcriptional regulator n=1 Tax=unclassified Streptomyces TaxID=2593676 RepID=UPI00368769DD
MNTGEHTTSGDERVHDEQSCNSSALTELRRRLDDGRAKARLNQTQLAKQAELGRTTVSEALSARGDVPSVDTVAALARVLKLPVGELLKLQRTAAEESGTTTTHGPGPGRPIGQWEPHELEVHPAGPGEAAVGADAPVVRTLPGYVHRKHDQVLGDAVREAADRSQGR